MQRLLVVALLNRLVPDCCTSNFTPFADKKVTFAQPKMLEIRGGHFDNTKVTEIMSEDLPNVTPEDTVEFCMQLMTEKNIRYLPVFENSELVGIVSINDLVRETILTQQETISQLKDYLHASM